MASQRLISALALLLLAVAFSRAQAAAPVESEADKPLQCYHNDKNTWYVDDCDSELVCILDPSIQTEDECVFLGSKTPAYPNGKWTTDRYSCRKLLHAAGNCSKYPTDPNAVAPEDGTHDGEGEACYVSDTYYAPTCDHPRLCQLKTEYPTELACEKSGYNHSDWVKSEAECRAARKAQGNCH